MLVAAFSIYDGAVFRPSEFRDLVSGRRRGVAATALRGLLSAAEVPYTLAVRWRNRRYDRGAAGVHRIGVPVISVGNLTLGGTGKTPLVHWLVRWFWDHGTRAGVISRGYGARAADTPNDEARELELRLPGVPHVEQPDRVAAAQRAIKDFHCQALVLDDGFQHRRIARDLDIVLLDALEPFGFGHVFPRGTLREPLDGLARADVVALSRADMLSSTDEIRREVERYNSRALWLELAHRPRSLVSGSRTEQPLESLAGQPVAAFCGIGNPAGFRHTLDRCGYNMIDFREFPDHYAYTPRDIESLAAWANSLNVAAVVCTEKDLVKLAIDRLGRLPLWAVSIGLEVVAGREALEARLAALL